MTVRSKRSLPLVSVLALLVSAACDIPTRMSLGPVSGSALLSASLAAVALVSLPAISEAPNQWAVTPLVPWIAFALWATVLMALSPFTVSGAQNLVLFWLFPATTLITACYVDSRARHLIQKSLLNIGWFLAGSYALGTVLLGSGSVVFLGSRSFAIEALFIAAMAIPLSVVSSGRKVRWLPWVLGGLVVVSLSRTAIAMMILFFAAKWAIGERRIRAPKLLLLALIGASALVLAIRNVPILRERFMGGDKGFRYEGITISLQGRDTIWRALLQGLEDYWLFGRGPGSSELQIARYIPSSPEPHNEYLRALHDTGFVGLLLLVTAMMTLAVAIVRRLRRSVDPVETATHRGAALALLALIATCMTDNTMVYSFAMAPLGLIIGLSLALPVEPHRANRRGTSRRSDQLPASEHEIINRRTF